MKTLKKILSVILAFGIIAAFSACEKEEPEKKEDPEFSLSKEETENNTDTPYINGWTADIEKSDYETEEEYEDAFLTEWVETLKPTEVFETKSEYPLVIKEIFEILIEKDEYYHSAIICDIKVLGDENEFYVGYSFIAGVGDRELHDDGHMMIRVGKNEEGKYCLLGRGGGPLGHGLEKSEITLGDVWQGRESGRDAALTEWAENLEPIEVFDTKTVYPEVIGEIFGIMMEKESEENKAKEVKDIDVQGGENEFFVRYSYSTEAKQLEELCIRVKMNNEGFNTLVAKGWGPIYYGLKPNSIGIEEAGLE